jgi:hypothetical protein
MQFDLLEVLHQTLAVCRHPQASVREAITASGIKFQCLSSFLMLWVVHYILFNLLVDVVIDVWDLFVGTRSSMQMLNTEDRLFYPFLGLAALAAVVVDFCMPWDVKEDNDASRL